MPETSHIPKRRALIDWLWPAAIGGGTALVVAGFMMVAGAPAHPVHVVPATTTSTHQARR
ncbi:MAG: hypothetical protein ABSA93_28870 [Streptosporangiaceae bacterium]